MTSIQRSATWRLMLTFVLLAGSITFGVLGCNAAASSDAAAPATAPSVEAPTTGPSPEQLTFQSPAEALDALIAAAKTKDNAELRKLLGPTLDDIVSGDPVQNANDLESFAKHAAEADRIEQTDDSHAIVHIGKADWPFPIPLVKAASGQWYFDSVAGKDEILDRRIGDNELKTISVVRAYVDAQREYASQDRMGDSVLQYAQKIRSTAGKRDGLYWPVAEGEDESPLGPLVAEAQDDGYGKKLGSGHEPYHGYFYRILTKQGPATPAGAYDYIINGRMIAGFALVAYPSQYGNTGIMTFVVNHQGKVYQKDLGPGTADAVSQMDTYNPDDTWTLVK
jgi:Protein of unknown function (DUF2950)